MHKIHWLSVAVATSLTLSLGPVSPARADGTFLQADLGTNTSDAVFAISRGKVSFGANFSDYEGGWSTGAVVTRDFALGEIGTLKVGPSIGRTLSDDNWRLGVRAGLEHYSPTRFGHVFLLAQYNTIDQDWFALFQAGNRSGLGLELSAGGSDTYSERTIAVTQKIGDGPVSIRAGWRAFAKEAFVGLSINTY
ncbi:hypothetical protein B6V75_03965 [Thioclava sp. F1Mire-8]|uniref:hypothetical protein n=1 Tax=Thioclava sp. F1Mire-8 TaxID=1973006 RepID=UPI000B540805|nr:hypothetical protein [Thioclava sp. F1Mire-8]OWY05287.1 hypothetical protein B6V75_03965 [Thioclava sp. F1Mire-8]